MKAYNVEFRRAVLTAYEYFRSMRKTSEVMKVSIASISRWSRHLDPKKRAKTSVTLSEVLRHFVDARLSQRPKTTCTAISADIRRTFGIEISRQLVGSIVRALGFARKRVRQRVRSGAQNGLGDVATRRVFVETYKRLRRDSDVLLVSVDESGFSTRHVSGLYGYARRGQDCVVYCPYAKDKLNYSLLMALDSDGGAFYRVLDGGISTTAQTFAAFVRDTIASLAARRRGRRLVFVADNVSFHKSAIVRAELGAGAAEMVFLPPYSPEFNAIELMFGIIKRKFYDARFEDDFDGNRVGDAVRACTAASISESAIRGCFRHVDARL